MPFQEKSAWIMLLALLLSGIPYISNIVTLSHGAQLPPPNIQQLVYYTIILILIAVIGHIIITAFSAKDANAKLDERERRIFDRAGKLAGYVFGFGSVGSLIFYLFFADGNLLFYGVLGSLIIGQLVEYITKIYFYRWNIL